MVNPTTTAGRDFWGQLLKPDHTPTDLCRNLLQGLAICICTKVEPIDVKCLIPAKLAAFYRLVGGNYDPVFVDTPHSVLSSIYQSLGCRHSLGQPKNEDFAAPSIPVLTRDGFVKWQLIQLRLDPGDHVPFLQAAVQKFDIVNPDGGDKFPKFLPKEALPSEPDEELTKWHDKTCRDLGRQLDQEKRGYRPARADGYRAADHANRGSDPGGWSKDGADYFSSRQFSSNATTKSADHLSSNWSSQPGKGFGSAKLHTAHRGPYDRRRSYQEEFYSPKSPIFDQPLPSRHRGFPRSRHRRGSSSTLSDSLTSSSSSDSDSETEKAAGSSSGPSLRHHWSQETFPLNSHYAYTPRPREVRRSSDQPLYASREFGPRASSKTPHVNHIPKPTSFPSQWPGVESPRNARWKDVNSSPRIPKSPAVSPERLSGGLLGKSIRLPERLVERVTGRDWGRSRLRREASPPRR